MIREFFLDEKPGIPFKLFGGIHFGCLAILIISLIMVYKYRHKIKNIKDENKKKIRLTMFIILISNMLIWYGSYIYYGVYDIRVHLPLHFCFIAGNLFMIYLLTLNRKLCKLAIAQTLSFKIAKVITCKLTNK